jgi:2-polyprenyl-3-methyl-5-hydroxy-6-metoxy-1,4-benzoquinol methylase
MCEHCGFFTYPDRVKSEEEILAYYRTNYRPGPQANNLFTGERKLQYHQHFLGPLFEEWKKAGKNEPVIGEVGAAYGLFLNWCKQAFPKATIHGTELTETYRRVAFHEFGLRLEEEFDYTKKYDLIASYHVLEHQANPDVMLKKYADCLKDDGIFYLSCPVWFRDANNGGTGGFDIEAYWAEDHINGWAEEHLEYIIARSGLEVVHKNDDVYGNTYILKKSNGKAVMQPKFDANKYLEIASKMFKVWQCLQENDSATAIELWKNCPAAWVHHYEFNRNKFHNHQEELEKFLQQAIESCPNSHDALSLVGDIKVRYERYDEAIEYLNRSLKKKPGNPTTLMSIANCFRMKALKEKDNGKKVEYLKQSINILRYVMNISTECLPQAISWAYNDEALIPIDP